MRKAFGLILIFGVFFVAIQVGYNFIKTEHEVTYKLNAGDSIVEIKEIYENNRYKFKINYKDNEFVYLSTEDFNKQKNIIEEIKVYEKDDIICVYPVLYNQKQSNIAIECTRNEKLYTYESLVMQNPSIKEFVEDLKKEKLESPSWQQAEIKEFNENYDDILFENYLPEKIELAYWDTGVLHVYEKGTTEYEKTLPSADNYNNNLNTIVDNYYVAPSDFSDISFSKFIFVDLKTKEYSNFYLEDSISINSFINGVVDGKLYLTDISNLKQYEIDPKNKKITEVGNINNIAKYHNGEKWKEKSIYEIANNNLKFPKKPIELNVLENYSIKEIYETEYSYYFLTNNYEVYQIIKGFEKNPINLTKVSTAHNFRVVDDNVFFIEGEYLYVYNHDLGQKPLIRSREFAFNIANKNIFEVYKK